MTAPEDSTVDRPRDRWRRSGEPVLILRPELLDPDPEPDEQETP